MLGYNFLADGFFGKLNDFGQLILTVIALTAFAGVGLMRTRIAGLSATLDDCRKEIEDKDRRDKDKDTKIDLLEKADKHKTEQINSLRALVQGAPNWKAISDKLDTHHHEATHHWTIDENLLIEIRDELKARK